MTQNHNLNEQHNHELIFPIGTELTISQEWVTWAVGSGTTMLLWHVGDKATVCKSIWANPKPNMISFENEALYGEAPIVIAMTMIPG